MKRLLRSLATRWSLIVPVAVVGAMLLSWAVVWAVEDSVAEDRMEELQKTADALARRINAITIDGRLMGAETLLATTDPDVKRMVLHQAADNDPVVMRKLDEFRAIFHAQNCQIIDKDGRVGAYSTDEKVSGTGHNVAWRPYFQRAIAGTPNVYAAVGTNTAERGLYFAVPITAGTSIDGQPIGAVVFKIGLDGIDALLAQRSTPALLLSPQGVVFAANDPQWRFALAGAATKERLAAIDKLRQFGNIFTDQPPASLPFNPLADRTAISALSLGVARASVTWGDPAGDWTLMVSEDSSRWLSARQRYGALLGSGLLGGLLALAVVMMLRAQVDRHAALDRLRLLSLAIEHSPVGVFITTAQRVIHYVNPKVATLTGYGAAELEGDTPSLLRSEDPRAEETYAQLDACLRDGRGWAGEMLQRRKDGTQFWAKTEVAPMRDAKGVLTHFVTMVEDISERKHLEERVAERTHELEQALTQLAEEKDGVERAMARLNEAHAELNQVNRRINESIRYASRIQSSLLPADGAQTGLHDIAIGWRPRDVVGGDLYWIGRFGDRCLIAVMDCTGHGVPGAFMTAIVASVLDRILYEHCHDDPAQILQLLNKLVKSSLRQEHHEPSVDFGSDDGLDAAICLVDLAQSTLTFAGANLPLAYTLGDQIKEIKGNRHSLGYRTSRVDYQFTNHQLTLCPGQTFYLATDGVTDQVGGPSRRLFGRKRLAEALLDGAALPASGQLERVFATLAEYRGQEVPRDDMTLLIFTPLAPENMVAESA